MKIQVVPIFSKTRELEVQLLLLLWMGKDTWHGDTIHTCTPYVLGGNKEVQESAQFGQIPASALRPKID